MNMFLWCILRRKYQCSFKITIALLNQQNQEISDKPLYFKLPSMKRKEIEFKHNICMSILHAKYSESLREIVKLNVLNICQLSKSWIIFVIKNTNI